MVAARVQQYNGGGRLGFSLTLGAPSLSSQYYFADGEDGDGIDEQYAIFNPTDQDVTVYAIFLGIDPAVQDMAARDGRVLERHRDRGPSRPGRHVVDDDVPGLPSGRHGASFATYAGDSIVVERVITRPAGDRSPPRSSWARHPASRRPGGRPPSGPSIALENVLVVLNVDSADTTVTVSALGPGGLVPVPGPRGVAVARAPV